MLLLDIKGTSGRLRYDLLLLWHYQRRLNLLNSMEMIISQHLEEFYLKNGIPVNGGDEQSTFEAKIGFLKLTLPNPEFRRKLVYIHDIEHVLNQKSTSWKDEGFIAGWEIGTGFWKYFPINLFVFWAFGYSLWISPKSVWEGFKKGLGEIGIVDLDYTKEELMNMELTELSKLIVKDGGSEIGFWSYLQFGLSLVVSQFVLFFPPFLILGIYLALFNN
ncbi:MAG: hypothetical protein ACJAWV_002889 [Flammeovirgaceae bacterium]|jgi:hypothetical protein